MSMLILYPVLDITPRGVQFDHWHDPLSPTVPITLSGTQSSTWGSFSVCLWVQTSYTTQQTAFSYRFLMFLL